MPAFFTSQAASKIARACIARDFRIDDAQAAAAMAEHRVELVQLLHAACDRLGRDADLLGQLRLLVRRRAAGTRAAADRAGGSSPAGPSSPGTCRRSPSRWMRQQLGQRLLAIGQIRRPGSSRGSRRCGRRTCARCGTGRCLRRRRRSLRAACFGSSAFVRTLSLRCSSTQLHQLLVAADRSRLPPASASCRSALAGSRWAAFRPRPRTLRR